VHELLRHDLVDELHLLVYPLVLGEGKRLFPAGVRTPFTRKHTVAYPSGVVGLHYERAR
jgi:dihydrofolate reductase